MVGLLYPALLVSGLSIWSAHNGLRAPINWTLLSLAAIVLGWNALLLVAGLGIYDVAQTAVAHFTATAQALAQACKFRCGATAFKLRGGTAGVGR